MYMYGTAGYYAEVSRKKGSSIAHQRNGCHSPLAEVDSVLHHNGAVLGGADPALDLALPHFQPVEGHLPDGLVQVAAHRQPGGESKSDTGT